jgi:hypothetical protein
MTNDNHDNFDDILNDMAEGMAEYLNMRLQLLRAEAQLEDLIRKDMVEVLTDQEGNFTYRFSPLGIKTYQEKFGIMPSFEDITFAKFAGLD